MEFNFIPKSRKYLSAFVTTKLPEYEDFKKESQNYTYHKKRELIGFIDSVIGNLEDCFLEIEIPENYPTAIKLIEKAEMFLKHLETYDELFDEIMIEYRNYNLYHPVSESYKIKIALESVFIEFINLAKKELNPISEVIKPETPLEEKKAIDVRKLTIPEAVRETIKFVSRWDIGAHLVLWPLLFVILGSIAGLLSTCSNKSDLKEKEDLIKKMEINSELMIKYKLSLDSALMRIDSLTTNQNNLKNIINDTSKTFTSQKNVTEASPLKDTKPYYINKNKIDQGQAFTDTYTGVSITITNITNDYKAKAFYDIPESFHTLKNNPVNVFAGKFWNFTFKNKKYKLIISSLDPLLNEYGIELTELK